MFVAQALAADGAASRRSTPPGSSGRSPAEARTTDTGAYCKARGRLPLSMVSTLTRQTGGLVTDEASGGWHWRDRRVRLADGATMTSADTAENQAEYPQPNSQKAGLGFPLGGWWLALPGDRGVLDAAVGPCEGKGSDEQTLLRDILERSSRARSWSGTRSTRPISCSRN